MPNQRPFLHCEIKGSKTDLINTKSLTKINSVVITSNFINPQVDQQERIIYSDDKPPIKFFEELYVPSDLKDIFFGLYATVEDYEDLEQSTGILSDQGLDIFMGRKVIKLVDYIKGYDVLNFPDTMFFVSASKNADILKERICKNCSSSFFSVGKKYMSKKIVKEQIALGKFGEIGILWPGYDVAFTDLSDKHPIGNGYMFKVENDFIPVDLCSNECGVEYCKQMNVLIYYADFINKGKMRVLSKYTEAINENLKNDYKFRSSNL